MEKNLSSASLLLPQFTALLPKGPAPNHLLISGGRPPEADWLQKAAQGRILWAADHGLDSCYRSSLEPAYFLGDHDSVSEEALNWAKSLAIHLTRYEQSKMTNTMTSRFSGQMPFILSVNKAPCIK